MHFQTVYDISVAGCRAWFLAPAMLALVVIGARYPVTPNIAAISGRLPMSRTAGVTVFGIMFLLAFVMTWGSYWTLRRDLSDGNVSRVQGLVTGVRPAATNQGMESFLVDGRKFSYARHQLSQGFDTLSVDGGPIAKGRCVRIVYVGDHILKLSLARSPGASGLAEDRVPPSLSETTCRNIE
jgi:hypothetical protein